MILLIERPPGSGPPWHNTAVTAAFAYTNSGYTARWRATVPWITKAGAHNAAAGL